VSEGDLCSRGAEGDLWARESAQILGADRDRVSMAAEGAVKVLRNA
jgi:hypothetical protein